VIGVAIVFALDIDARSHGEGGVVLFAEMPRSPVQQRRESRSKPEELPQDGRLVPD